MENVVYLLIYSDLETGNVFQIKTYRNLQDAINTGKLSLEDDYDRGITTDYFFNYFGIDPSLEEIIEEWKKCNYYYEHLQIVSFG